MSGMFWAHIPKLSWENNLGFWGCPRTRFQVTLAALTSVACCSFFLRMRLWCSSPRWMRSLSSLSLSSTSQWQSMLSAAFTGFALVPASLGVTLLQNRNRGHAASRHTNTTPAFLPTLSESNPGRCTCLHCSIFPQRREGHVSLGILVLLWEGDPRLWLPLLLCFPCAYCPFLVPRAG